MRITHNKGTSITETMISAAVMTFLIAGIMSTFYIGNVSWAVQDTSITLQGDVRRAMTWLTRDLRVATDLDITVSGETDALTATFTKSPEGAVSYAWTPAAGDGQYQFVRTTDTNSVVIANDITALTINESATEIAVSVTGTTTTERGTPVTYNLNQDIAIRQF